MVTLNLSATAIFVFGLATGLILGVVGLCIVAVMMSKKK